MSEPNAAEVLGLLTVELLQEHYAEAREIAMEIRIHYRDGKPIAADLATPAQWQDAPLTVAGTYWMRNIPEGEVNFVYRIVEIVWIENYWGGRWVGKGWYLLTIYDRNNYPETVEQFIGDMKSVAFCGPLEPPLPSPPVVPTPTVDEEG